MSVAKRYLIVTNANAMQTRQSLVSSAIMSQRPIHRRIAKIATTMTDVCISQRTSHRLGQKKTAKGASTTNTHMIVALALSEFALMATSMSQRTRTIAVKSPRWSRQCLAKSADIRRKGASDGNKSNDSRRE